MYWSVVEETQKNSYMCNGGHGTVSFKISLSLSRCLPVVLMPADVFGETALSSYMQREC